MQPKVSSEQTALPTEDEGGRATWMVLVAHAVKTKWKEDLAGRPQLRSVCRVLRQQCQFISMDGSRCWHFTGQQSLTDTLLTAQYAS